MVALGNKCPRFVELLGDTFKHYSNKCCTYIIIMYHNLVIIVGFWILLYIHRDTITMFKKECELILVTWQKQKADLFVKKVC
jgi:hypothetical protein